MDVKILIHQKETIKLREEFPEYPNAFIGTILSEINLYRVVDGYELALLQSNQQFKAGIHSLPIEQSAGSCWSSQLDTLIIYGNLNRGKYLGQQLYLCQIDGQNKKFLYVGKDHLPIDFNQLEMIIPAINFNTGTACCLYHVNINDIKDFYSI